MTEEGRQLFRWKRVTPLITALIHY